MEFIEAPGFTHHLAVDLTREQRKTLKAAIDAEKKSRARR